MTALKLKAPMVLITCLALSVLIFIVDIQIPLGVAGGVPYVVVILLALWSRSRKTIIYFAFACSILTLLGFYFSPEGGEMWKVISNRALALFAIWVTALLAIKWESYRRELVVMTYEAEKEKEKKNIYQAMLQAEQHITNNLLNQLQVVEMEIQKHSDFDKNVAAMMREMLAEAEDSIKQLSAIKKIDENSILQSIYPKNTQD